MLVNRAVLAEIIGTSESGLTTFADQGMPVRRDGHGTAWQADPADCVAWLLQRERERAVGAAPVAAQRERLLRAQADRAELDARRLAGGLLLAVDVERVTFATWRGVRDALTAIPDRLGPVVAGERDSGVCVRLLHAELRAVLHAVTDEVTGRGTAWIAPLVLALGRELDAWAHAAHPGDPADLEALRARLAAACEAFATGSAETPVVDRALEPEGADRG